MSIKKDNRPDSAKPLVSPKSKESAASSTTTSMILRLLSLMYRVNHVHIKYRRGTVNKLVPAFDKTGKVYLVDAQGNQLFVNQKQYASNGGRTYAAVILADGRRIEAVAITNNQSRFVKAIGYSQALLNLWNILQADTELNYQISLTPNK